MNETHKRSNAQEQHEAIEKLVQDLAEFESQMSSGVDDEMLSLMVDEAYKGIDISTRYPRFYRKLLKNANLRHAFLDALEALEMADQGALASVPDTLETDLSFLADPTLRPDIEILGQDRWRTRWQRTIDQLQAIFSPLELAYRFDPSLSEDPWFTLLRGEAEIHDVLYAVVLECTLSEKDEEAFSTHLNIAVTLGTANAKPSFPIQATLEWGNYHETLQFSGEDRVRFPDIPVAAAYDDALQHIRNELNLTIETIT